MAELSDRYSGPLLLVRVDPASPGRALRSAEPLSCGFCPPAQATGGGRTVTVRTPAELTAAAIDARPAGLRWVLLTTGPGTGVAGPLTEYVQVVRSGFPELRVEVECRLPTDLRGLGALAAAGVTDVGIHVGPLDDEVRARRTGDGAALSLASYERAWDEAVRVFGRYRVSTCLVVGAGEHPGELVAGAARLIARGVHPVVVPADDDGPTTATAPLVRWIGQAVTDMLRAVGAGASQQQAPQQQAPELTTGWGMR